MVEIRNESMEPEYWNQRNIVFDRIFDRQQKELLETIAKRESRAIKVTLGNGDIVEATAGETNPLMLLKNHEEAYLPDMLRDAVVAKVIYPDGTETLWDIPRVLEEDCRVEFMRFDDELGKHTYWHSSAHVLGEALEMKYGCLLNIGPPTEDGFYYDVMMENGDIIKEEDFKSIQAFVNKIMKQRQTFQRIVAKKEEALEMFGYSKYKTDIINRLGAEETITAYRCGQLIDLCRGPHIPHTGCIKAFSITKNSSAYWKGDSSLDSMQRLYGVTFPSKVLMKEYIHLRQEAAKRDHRLIGKKQELFFFHSLSAGCAFFYPHGTRIYQKLVEFLRDAYLDRGYDEVITPNIYDSDLWKTSGHWDHYSDSMFQLECEKRIMALKPMNCPGHCLMFTSRNRSYRELPLRYAEFGICHRNEMSGALHGLTRVRRFVQDDAHIFCRPCQVKQEIIGCIDFMKYCYTPFGLEFTLELSTRPDKFLGEIEIWDSAEKQLKEVLDDSGFAYKINHGDGAFYGPKIDVHIRDALKRMHQCATIQLDFQLPQRFNLEYSAGGEIENEKERPIMIHRALYGSLERFIAVLCEHTGGKWPFWISPRQCVVIPVSDKFCDYAVEVCNTIKKARFWCDVELSDKKLQKKIRECQLAQYNFLLVVGQQELDDRTVNVRTRDNVVHGKKTLEELLQDFRKLDIEKV